MVNIGVGPATPRPSPTIAVLRPRLDHAGPLRGLRNSQQLGDYVLAHGYVREDPCWTKCRCGCPSCAGRDSAGASKAVAGVSRECRRRPQAHHAHRHRGQHRQPQLGTAARQPAPAPLQPEPRRGAGHGSATIAANGFRFRVPYGTLLCVSDKPLHGEIKLPGMANHFYRERVDQHLRIGIPRWKCCAPKAHGPPAQPQAAQLCGSRLPVNAAPFRTAAHSTTARAHGAGVAPR